MAELKNSQRVSYKATYNQLAPSTTVRTPGKNMVDSLSRAVEKTAFVQSLQIIPQELAAIQEQLLSGHAKISSGNERAIRQALLAIEHLINDRTTTSTLNNAALFAKISHSTLILIGNGLITYRRTIVNSINESVAAILTTYRTRITQRTQMPSQSATPTLTSPAKGSNMRSTTTDTGIPVLTSITRSTTRALSKTSNSTKLKLQSSGYRIHVTIDESMRAPGTFSSALSSSPAATYMPSNAEAIAWAEKYQPKLFIELTKQLQPYMAISANERIAVGGPKALLNLLTTTFASIFDTNALSGIVAGFRSRMTIEPVGNLHLERVEMYPAGVERGELVHSVPLAPGETVNISHKEWSTSEKEFEDFVQDYFEGYSEQGVAEKTDIAMSSDSQSQHSTALNLGASLTANYTSVTLSTNFGYNATSNDSQSKKDSRNHSMELTKKASARTKKDHKVSFKVTSVAGSEDQSVQVISNPSQTDSMRLDYFQLARKWKVDLLRYGLRMTYDVVIPNPGSGIFTLVDKVMALDALINTPFVFTLPLSNIYYDPFATSPQNISNYDQLAALYSATVTAPPQARKWVNVHKETAKVSDSDYSNVHFDSIDFEIDENYYIFDFQVEHRSQTNVGESRNYFKMIGGESISDGITRLTGKSGHLSLDFYYQYIYNFAINITFSCRPKVQVLLDWRLQVWNEIRQAAEDQYNKSLQEFRDQQAELIQQIAEFDALTLRRMEQEEIMKGVLRWLFGPQFSLVPFNISILFGPDSNDPGVQEMLDPNRLNDSEWLDIMERGEFIKYIHNAIEWENVLYFTYPYFWDDNRLWDLKKFLFHPDPTHRTFLRSGAARVVLTIRPGFEPSFTSLIESGAFGGLPGPHPYVTIAQEIEDFANTNYPGFPPANPEQNARPLLYLEQRRVWKEMQFIIQLVDACKTATGAYPPSGAGDTVPTVALTPFLNGPVIINGVNYNGINDYNTKANNQQLALDPATPQEALLPTYANVPISDLVWNNPYFYQCPGESGDYDLICYGADGQAGGTDKDADISANCEASLISTWYEYTPTSAMDIGITMNQPNVVPPEPSPEIA